MSNKESGAVMVFVALFIGVVVIFAAMSIESGRLTHARNQGQTAVDAAALAGAKVLPAYRRRLLEAAGSGDGGVASSENLLASFVSSLNYNNRFEGDATTIALGDVTPISYDPVTHVSTPTDFINANGITVRKQFQLGHILGSILGKSSSPIQVNATALAGGGPSCVEPTLPLVLGARADSSSQDSYCAYQPMTGSGIVTDNATTTPSTNDSLAFFDIEQPSSACGCEQFVFGSRKQLCIGDVIYINNGRMANCMKSIAESFLSSDYCDCTVERGQGGGRDSATTISCNPERGCSGSAGQSATTTIGCSGANCALTAVLPVISYSDLEDATGQGNFVHPVQVIGFANVQVNQLSVGGLNNPEPKTEATCQGGQGGDGGVASSDGNQDTLDFTLLDRPIQSRPGGLNCWATSENVALID